MAESSPQRELWQAELAASIRDLESLAKHLPHLDLEALRQVVGQMRLSITPHSAKLIDWTNPHDPLFKLAIPNSQELRQTIGEITDPNGDDKFSPIPFLTHRYPDRVLVYATYACSQYCRFCFRREKTGVATAGPAPADLDRIVTYLNEHPAVEEVIVTGGDPLILTDQALDKLLGCLRSVPTVRRLRIHTRVPVNLPSRITPALVDVVRRHQSPGRPVYIVTHFNHPRELANENLEAIALLADAGLVIRNQSVLLAGVNDNAATLELLFRNLVDHRVVPYYLHQLDLARGTNHFRVPIEQGEAIFKQLHGRLTGIALPRYMLELPSGQGKVQLGRAQVTKSETGNYTAESWDGKTVNYHEPVTQSHQIS